MTISCPNVKGTHTGCPLTTVLACDSTISVCAQTCEIQHTHKLIFILFKQGIKNINFRIQTNLYLLISNSPKYVV
jgi:hypothetical protein